MSAQVRELRERAAAWLAGDPDPATRAELQALLDAVVAGGSDAAAELAACFAGTLGFGTAGLRAPLGPGPNRMNRAVVMRATNGLTRFLRSGHERSYGPDAPLVVVSYDARHHSRAFAEAAAGVVTGDGFRAALLPGPLPTPVLAFAVRHLDAAAGVMITASHNPAADNGYKVYLADGAQVAPPDDAAIAAEIAAVSPACGIPLGPLPHLLDDSVVQAYLDRALSRLEPGGARALRVAYTPLHGVAGPTFLHAWARAGFDAPEVVAEQAEPDPDFPTVAFPNPEEPGALDLAVALALRHRADLVLAHDPDGDRCAVMVPELGAPGTVTGYRQLSGDEVGVLLAEHLMVHRRLPDHGTLATTIVSSPQLARLAAAHGHPSALTLTGFKWLARVPDLAYAYEEALGYCTDPEAVRDKDGITAALLIAEMAALSREHGLRLTDRLDALARRDGVHVTAARSIPLADPAAAAGALECLLADPPAALAGAPVGRVDDLRAAGDDLPPTDGVRLHAGPVRAVLRPSGTEPKLKIYLHAALDPPVNDVATARRALTRTLAVAGDELVRHLTGPRGPT